VKNVMRHHPRRQDLGFSAWIGQPKCELVVEGAPKADRYGSMSLKNCAGALETAVGGKAVSQIMQGEQRY